MKGHLLALAVVGAIPVQAQDAAELRAAREEARAATAEYRAGRIEAYRDGLRRALRVQPAHPIWLFNLAGASALAGDTAAALQLLDSLASLGYALDPARDTDFAALHGQLRFEAVSAGLRANGSSLGRGRLAAQLEGAAFLPEGIAYDPVTRSLFVGSVHQRRIVRVRDGLAMTFADSSAGLWSVLGMAAAPATRSLWVVTAVTPAMRGAASHTAATALVELDLDDGRVRRRILPSGGRHAFNDLTVSDSGVVYISDTAENAVYEWSEHGGLRPLVPPGRLMNPSGLALMPGTEWLYVADYSVGLTRVSTRDGSVERLASAPGISTYGTDGVARHGRDLLIIQNALPPHRVARLRLSEDGSRIDSMEVLERAREWYDEPTLGVVVDDAFFYVANSRWQSFREGEYIGDPGAAGPIILRLPSAPSAPPR